MLRVATAILIGILLFCFAIAIAPALRPSSPVAVFDGVSDADLAQFDIRVMDYRPAATPHFSDAGFRRTLSESPGVTIESSQLVTARVPGYSSRLAWAIRVNTSQVPDWVAECMGPACQFGPGRSYSIVFFDAQSGDRIGSFTRIPPAETQFVGTQPPTTR